MHGPDPVVAVLGNKGSNAPMDPAAFPEELNDLIVTIGSNRDKGAFAVLFDAIAPRIKGYLRRLGNGEDGIEDLVQDVMLTVWHHAHQFDPARASASTWIFTIARNRRIDVFRRESRPELDPAEPMLAPSSDLPADEHVQAEQHGAELRNALKELPREQADLLKMAFFDDKSHSMIAAETGLPLGTIKSRLRLATNKLHSRLEYLR